MTEEVNERLSPIYKPAEIDSTLAVRFHGNTAQVADMKLANVDPFQMLAASEYMKMKAFQFIQQAEINAAKQGLAVPKPGEGLAPSGFMKGS